MVSCRATSSLRPYRRSIPITLTQQQKAARTRAERAATRVWEDVKRQRKGTGCTCALRKGMDYAALAKLRGGCTDTPERAFDGKEGGGRYVCPTLDFYRRAVGNPLREEAAA